MKEMVTNDKRISGKVWKAYQIALARYAQRPEVTGIDIGLKRCRDKATATIAIRIHVREKFGRTQLEKWETIPKTINGVPTDIIQATYCNSACFDPIRATAVNPFQPGLSIGPIGGLTGTLGCIVTDNVSGAKGILSCRHILASSNTPAPGDPIVQPGPSNGGRAANVVAAFERVDTPTDSGLALLTGGRAHVPQQYGSGVVVSRTRYPQIGDILEKSSLTTGVTRGLVDGIGIYAGLSFSFHLARADDNSECQISEPGDSGAIWYHPASAKAVGLHVKGEASGSDLQDFAIATSVKKIEWFLNVTV